MLSLIVSISLPFSVHLSFFSLPPSVPSFLHATLHSSLPQSISPFLHQPLPFPPSLHTYIQYTYIHSLTSLPPLFFLFQTLCYNRLPSSRNEDGLVMLQFSKSDSVLLSQQDTVTKDLQALVNTATVQVVVDAIRPLPDNWYIHVLPGFDLR